MCVSSSGGLQCAEEDPRNSRCSMRRRRRSLASAVGLLQPHRQHHAASNISNEGVAGKCPEGKSWSPPRSAAENGCQPTENSAVVEGVGGVDVELLASRRCGGFLPRKARPLRLRESTNAAPALTLHTSSALRPFACTPAIPQSRMLSPTPSHILVFLLTYLHVFLVDDSTVSCYTLMHATSSGRSRLGAILRLHKSRRLARLRSFAA